VIEQFQIDGPAERTTETSTNLESAEPLVVATGNELNDDERSASTLQRDVYDDVPAEPGSARTEPATHRPERRVASATARRGPDANATWSGDVLW
jgi:hypothetical protein